MFKHRHREAEPKDYDFTACRDREKKLHKSTYKHLGTFVDADWSTTTESQLSQYFLKKEYEFKETPKSMVHPDHIQSVVFDRLSHRGCRPVLPCHRPDYNDMDLNSTYTLDYLPPHITIKDTIPAEVVEDRKPDFRRRLSCFTDVAGHRRWGRNTWQDVNETQARPHGAAETLHTPLDRGCT
ncbi:cilia- and flagella-associated protein 95-like isoform X2 [Brachyhypopomus gauderio]|uniref:cilia- and flagella-associated protein 95-like isoform X2 n=1 Tax=Brachyhypopomus gauderio TaxID=698409 RepID=UPI004042F6A3